MRIEVRRTGGVAGIARTWEVDTATLPAGRAAEIERIAKGLAARSSQIADGFSYEVTIDGQSIVTDDAEALLRAIRGE